eukprot:1807616-Pleurochrysis_carterae.AAC.1
MEVILMRGVAQVINLLHPAGSIQLLFVVLLQLEFAHAPRALPTYRSIAADNDQNRPGSSASANRAVAALGVAATAVAAAAALRSITSVRPESAPPYINQQPSNAASSDGSRSSNGYFLKGQGRPLPAVAEYVGCDGESVDSEDGSDHAWDDVESDRDDNAGCDDLEGSSASDVGAGDD